MSSTGWVVSYVVLWVLVVLESLLLFVLLREIGKVYLGQSSSLARDGIGVGEVVPDVELAGLAGNLRLHSVFERARRSIVLFVNPDCPWCPDAIQAVQAAVAREDDLSAAVLAPREQLRAYGDLRDVVVGGVDAEVLRKTMLVRATPYALITDAEGTVLTKGVINGETSLDALLRPAEEIAASNGDEPGLVTAQRTDQGGIA
jgi:hypothetical protein